MHKRSVKSKEIELPDHMNSLPQSIIDDIIIQNNLSKIISCGVHPNDKSLCLITPDLDIKFIQPNGSLIPRTAIPSHDGSRIAITFESFDEIYAIDSQIAIAVSKSNFAKNNDIQISSSQGDFSIEGSVYLEEEHDNFQNHPGKSEIDNT